MTLNLRTDYNVYFIESYRMDFYYLWLLHFVKRSPRMVVKLNAKSIKIGSKIYSMYCLGDGVCYINDLPFSDEKCANKYLRRLYDRSTIELRDCHDYVVFD